MIVEDEIQKKYGPSFYNRIDIDFSNQSKKNIVENYITQNIPKFICDYPVKNVSKIDGIKLRLNDNHWLLFRFSGTEPLLRLYCEAPSEEILINSLNWSKNFIKDVIK